MRNAGSRGSLLANARLVDTAGVASFYLHDIPGGELLDCAAQGDGLNWPV
jgi:hypothetical protein